MMTPKWKRDLGVTNNPTALLAAACLVFGLAVRAEAVEYFMGDRDKVINNDRAGTISDQTSGISDLANGDFNGDGLTDLAFSLKRPVGFQSEIDLMLGGSEESTLTTATDFRILLAPSSITQFTIKVALADLNGDGKDDLIFRATVLPWKAAIFWGTDQLPRTVDLAAGFPDAWLNPAGLVSDFQEMTTGDFNADGVQDVAIGISASDSEPGEVVIVLGGSSFADGPIDRNDPARVFRLIGKPSSALGKSIMSADVNGDGIDDIIAKSQALGESYLIWGSTGLLGVWDLSTRPPPVLLVGRTWTCQGAGDFNGDHKADLFFFQSSIIPSNNAFLLLWGEQLASGVSALTLSSTTAGALHQSVGFIVKMTHVADFDGDGRDDLFLSDGERMIGALTTDHAPKPTVLNLNSLIIGGSHTCFIPGSFNRDAFADLVFHTVFPSGFSDFGALSTFFGFQPLNDPALSLDRDPVSSKRVVGRFSVRGHPTEMKLTGDVSEAEKDRWVPYAPTRRVELSPALGAKTVQVVYRNALGRMSEPVTANATLEVAQQMVRASRNRVAHGMHARWEVSMAAPGRLKAQVKTAQGQDVVILEDADRGAGVWALEWDGTNASGRRVAPGHYLLIIEAGGRTETQHIAMTSR